MKTREHRRPMRLSPGQRLRLALDIQVALELRESDEDSLPDLFYEEDDAAATAALHRLLPGLMPVAESATADDVAPLRIELERALPNFPWSDEPNNFVAEAEAHLEIMEAPDLSDAEIRYYGIVEDFADIAARKQRSS